MFELWRSAGGECICAQILVAQDDVDILHNGRARDEVGGVIAFFGQSDAAKALYAQAAIVTAQRISK